MTRTSTLAALVSLGVVALGAHACSDDGEPEVTGSGGGNGTGGSGGVPTTTSGQAGETVSIGAGGSTGEGGSCADLIVEATYDIKPADIIFVIDNSGSMSEEINSVETNINVNFASIIQGSGVDYQVIMVTNHGTNSYDVCIGPPLSGTTNCAGPPVEVMGLFYHYDVDVQSHDSLCTTIDTLYGSAAGGRPVQTGSDPNGIYVNGWASFLRQGAVKVFVEISDDGITCTCPSTYCTSPALSGESFGDGDNVAQGQTAALEWDSALLGLGPTQFGTPAARNYIYYSIVGLPAKPAPNNLDPYTEFEPVVTGTCPGGVGPGTGYQWLSKGTGGLRFPVCNYQSYDVVFQDIAAGVIDAVQIPCEFDLPDPPKGGTLDLETIDVLYTPGGGGMTQEWTKVDNEASCGPGHFYVDTVAETIILCPQACSVVESDLDATIQVKIQCGDIGT